MLCTQCRHSELDNSASLEVLEGAASAYFHDDHLVLLALGGLYDVFRSQGKRDGLMRTTAAFCVSGLDADLSYIGGGAVRRRRGIETLH